MVAQRKKQNERKKLGRFQEPAASTKMPLSPQTQRRLDGAWCEAG